MRTQKITNHKKPIFSKRNTARVMKFLWVWKGLIVHVLLPISADLMIISGAILISLSKFANVFFTLSAYGNGA